MSKVNIEGLAAEQELRDYLKTIQEGLPAFKLLVDRYLSMDIEETINLPFNPLAPQTT
jgi:hypothetical protein